MLQQRNEPSNLPWVIEALHPIAGGGLALKEFAASLKSRSLSALRLDTAEEGGSAPPQQGGEGGEEEEGGTGLAGVAYTTRDQKAGVEVTSKTEERSAGSAEGADTKMDYGAGIWGKREGRGGEDEGASEGAQAEAYYGCKQCRAYLFARTRVTNHGLATNNVVFREKKKGNRGRGMGADGGGLCSEFVFIVCEREEELRENTALEVDERGDAVSCVCGAKVGTKPNPTPHYKSNVDPTLRP